MSFWRAAPVVVAGVLLAGCSGYTGSLANEVREWVTTTSYQSLASQLSEDLSNISTGERLRELKPLRTACAGFAQDAASLEGELPAPDPVISSELAGETTDYYAAGSDCYGASTFSDRSYRSFLANLRAGEALADKATRRLAADGVR